MRTLAQRTVLSLSLSFVGLFSADVAAMDCPSRLYDLLKAAYPDAESETGDDGELLRTNDEQPRWIRLDEVACKVWPASPDKTLIAVRLYRQAAYALDEETTDLEVLVADSARARILQRYRENDALTADAIRISSVTLDTARYRLNEDTIAFGVRVGYSGSSRANPYASTVLSLYAAKGDALRPVLKKLEVSRERGEWDTNCVGEFESAQRTVAIDAKRDHGYAGLLINGVEETRRNVVEGEDCTDVAGPKKKTSARLAFDGREYAVPEDLRGL